MRAQELLRGSAAAASFAGALTADLKRMETALEDICAGAGTLAVGLTRVNRAGGKRLRPCLAWTSWHMCGGSMEITPLMTMLELMHTASLVHDDLVDGAAVRRGAATVNALEGAAAAVRSGDYLLSRAMEYLKIYRGSGINEALSAVSWEMCLGELEQRRGLFRASGLRREEYEARIRRKTALLMAESCRSGAVAGGGDKPAQDALYRYGLRLGMAFQLRDDLRDLLCGDRSGKAPMQDLQSGVVTLPMLLAAEKDPGILPLLERREKEEQEMETLRRRILDSGAAEETERQIMVEIQLAVEALRDLPSCPERSALEDLAAALSEVKGNA